jgi:ketol-acid reductoisomerase
MALTIYREADADRSALHGRRVTIIGYGNQGRAHALNLRDSGIDVLVGQRPGKSFDTARADGFEPRSVADAVANAELIILTLPDESASEVYAAEISPALRSGHVVEPPHPTLSPSGGEGSQDARLGRTLGFVHGFNIRFAFIQPPGDVDVVMVAPKGPGSLLRSLYVEGKGLPALMAIHQDASGSARRTALAWADAIGSTRAGVVETTFACETETDLFGEQVVLCGGVTALTKAAFETLVEAGYQPEFAYLECVHELKQIVDLIYERGLSAMRERISNTAEYGDLTRGPKLITEETRREMRRILDEVRSGAFAKEWIAEHRSGGKNFKKLHDADLNTLYEQAGKTVRSLMPWLNKR